MDHVISKKILKNQENILSLSKIFTK